MPGVGLLVALYTQLVNRLPAPNTFSEPVLPVGTPKLIENTAPELIRCVLPSGGNRLPSLSKAMPPVVKAEMTDETRRLRKRVPKTSNWRLIVSRAICWRIRPVPVSSIKRFRIVGSWVKSSKVWISFTGVEPMPTGATCLAGAP